jgi:hypothetical protein
MMTFDDGPEPLWRLWDVMRAGRDQAERERDEARAKLEATIDALGLAQRTIAATARTLDGAKVPSDLATVEDTVAGTVHNVTTVADRARWLVYTLAEKQRRLDDSEVRESLADAVASDERRRADAAESALRLAQAREARLVAAVRHLVTATNLHFQPATNSVIGCAIARVDDAMPPSPTVTSEESER